VDDYYSIVSKAVSRLGINTSANRHALYARARASFAGKIVTTSALTNEQIARARGDLDDAIRKVESEQMRNQAPPIKPHTAPPILRGGPEPIREARSTASTNAAKVYDFENVFEIEKPAGRIELSDETTNVTPSDGVDNSTFTQLSSHPCLEELISDSTRNDAPEEAKAHLKLVLEWLGVHHPEDIGPSQHEQWAHGFAQYLAEGHAPSTQLAPGFEFFKKAAANANATLPRTNVHLTDEVRGVMDHMLAADNEIMETQKTLTASGDGKAATNPTTATLPHVQGLVFFMVAFVFVFLIQVGVVDGLEALSGSDLSPRSLGWIAVPVSAGIVGWQFGRECGLEAVFCFADRKLHFVGRLFRFWIVGSVLWLTLMLTIFVVFDPLGWLRWHEEEWFKFLCILVGVPLFGLFGGFLFKWASKKRT
jgi:hypothetical protein